MSLETLLEAARYVEQLEKKRERAPSTSSSSDHSIGVAPYVNHHNSDHRSTKLKRERAEPDDLFCEEKMLIIDEEDPLETRTNGNYSSTIRRSPALANASRGTPPASNSGHVAVLHTSHSHQQHQNNHDGTHNHYLDNHNSNNSQSHVDVETPGYDNKKPSRNGPCMIRSGTREVHNKLEKNRRAHLKECFELLKRQLPTQDEKKSSNLSILHAAIRHIQSLKKKERDMEHEMERLAREKIASQQRIVALKKELSATWDHIDFSTLLPEQNSSVDNVVKNEPMEVDVSNLARSGTRYSSTSSLSSAATASSPQNLQTTSSAGSSIYSQAATAAVVCQTQGLNLAQGSRESPPASSSPGSSTPSIPTPAQEKVLSPNVIQSQTTTQRASSQQNQLQNQPQQHQLHLPISAQMLNTGQGLATIVPTLQHLGPGMRLIPGDTRQLLVTHAGNNECRPLIAVQSNAGSDPRPVALVVQSTAANDNRVTFVHSNLSTSERPLALAVQSSASEVRPVTFVHSGNEGRPLVLATHPPALNATNSQTRIRTSDAQATHKMVGGVTLVGGTGSELTRLPGGAELNILPANGVFRSVKAQPLAVQGGLTLSHAGVSLQPNANKGSTVVQSAASSEGIAHIVGQHTPLSGLTPIVTPMTVVSQGNQVTAHILAPSNLAGKVLTTPILKPVGQVPLVNAQYLNTLVKPVVVVTSPPSTPTTTATSNAPTPPLSQTSSSAQSSV